MDTAAVDTINVVVVDAGIDMVQCFISDSVELVGSTQGVVTTVEWWQEDSTNVVATTEVATIAISSGVTNFILYATDGVCFDHDTMTATIFPAPVADAGDNSLLIDGLVVQLGGEPAGPENAILSEYDNQVYLIDFGNCMM